MSDESAKHFESPKESGGFLPIKTTAFGCLAMMALPFAIVAAVSGTCATVERVTNKGPNQEILAIETALFVLSCAITIVLFAAAFFLREKPSKKPD